jgi:hypothetical protein
MRARVQAAALGLVATFLLIGAGAAVGHSTGEHGPALRLDRVCDGSGRSGVAVKGVGFAPDATLFAGLQIIEDGSLVFFVDGELIRASADGTIELSSDWDGPARYVVSIYDGSGLFVTESLDVDCSKPASIRDCIWRRWRDLGFKNLRRCVFSALLRARHGRGWSAA